MADSQRQIGKHAFYTVSGQVPRGTGCAGLLARPHHTQATWHHRIQDPSAPLTQCRQRLSRQNCSACQIAWHQSARAAEHAPCPFQRKPPCPSRGAGLRSGQKIQPCPDRGKADRWCAAAAHGGECFLLGGAQGNEAQAHCCRLQADRLWPPLPRLRGSNPNGGATCTATCNPGASAHRRAAAAASAASVLPTSATETPASAANCASGITTSEPGTSSTGLPCQPRKPDNRVAVCHDQILRGIGVAKRLRSGAALQGDRG